MHSEIVIFYELPSYLTSADEELVKGIIDIIRLSHTVIIFSATNKYDSFVDKTYRVKNGTVSLVKDNSNNKTYSLFDMLEDYEQSARFSRSTKRKDLSTILKRYAKENIDEYEIVE